MPNDSAGNRTRFAALRIVCGSSSIRSRRAARLWILLLSRLAFSSFFCVLCRLEAAFCSQGQLWADGLRAVWPENVPPEPPLHRLTVTGNGNEQAAAEKTHKWQQHNSRVATQLSVQFLGDLSFGAHDDMKGCLLISGPTRRPAVPHSATALLMSICFSLMCVCRATVSPLLSPSSEQEDSTHTLTRDNHHPHTKTHTHKASCCCQNVASRGQVLCTRRPLRALHVREMSSVVLFTSLTLPPLKSGCSAALVSNEMSA